MEIVNIADIEGTLIELLAKVELGVEVVITRDGEAIAKLSHIPRQLPRRPLTSNAELRARQTPSKTSTLETLQALPEKLGPEQGPFRTAFFVVAKFWLLMLS